MRKEERTDSDALEREMSEEIEKLKQETAEQARQEAEKSKSVIYQIGAALGKFVKGYIGSFTSHKS